MGGPTRIRDRRVRLADNLTDGKTPGQISLAIPSSVTEEDYQVFFLSRLREIIFGNDPNHHWYDNFEAEGILPLKELSALLQAQVRKGVVLLGTRDGHNRIFQTPNHFVHDPSGSGADIEVWHNGRRLMLAAVADPAQGDFIPSESGGVGTGFDTITLLTFAPVGKSNLVADYQISP